MTVLPHPDIRDWDGDNALALAELSQAAYAPMVPSHLQGVAQFVTPSTPRVLLVRDNETAVVAFRGSQVFSDFVADLDANTWPRLTAPGQVHDGAGEMLMTGFDEIVRGIGDLDGRDLWITGHSLGGQLAVLFAAEWTARGMPDPVAAVVTFGAPRPGNWSFRRWYRAQGIPTMRVVNRFDPIPHMPLLTMTYRHVGTTRWLFEGQVHGRTGTRLSLPRQVILAARRKPPQDPERTREPFWRDHGITEYIAAVAGL